MQKNLPVLNAQARFFDSLWQYYILLQTVEKGPAKLGFFCFQRYNRNGDEGC